MCYVAPCTVFIESYRKSLVLPRQATNSPVINTLLRSSKLSNCQQVALFVVSLLPQFLEAMHFGRNYKEIIWASLDLDVGDAKTCQRRTEE